MSGEWPDETITERQQKNTIVKLNQEAAVLNNDIDRLTKYLEYSLDPTVTKDFGLEKQIQGWFESHKRSRDINRILNDISDDDKALLVDYILRNKILP